MNEYSYHFSCGLNRLSSPQYLGQYDLLYPERTYLLTELRSQIETATDLLQKIPPLEEALASRKQPHLRRSLKKQLGWLRYRVKEATRQETAILIQLNQIKQEIQTRENFKQFRMEQQQRQQYYQLSSSPQTIYQGNHPTELVNLNPLSTEFHPQNKGILRLDGAVQVQQQDVHLLSSMNGNTALPRPGFSSQNVPFELSRDAPLRHLRPRVYRPPVVKPRRSSMDDGKSPTTPSHRPTHQTHSLPSTPPIDEKIAEEQTAETSRGMNGFGYFDLLTRKQD